METTPKKRGGSRPGAGRPKTAGKSYQFRSTPQSQAILERIPPERRAVSAYISAALIAYADTHAPEDFYPDPAKNNNPPRKIIGQPE